MNGGDVVTILQMDCSQMDGEKKIKEEKRDSSTAQTNNFTGVKLRKKRRFAPVGMTVHCCTEIVSHGTWLVALVPGGEG